MRKRVNKQEALKMLKEMPLGELMFAAHQQRMRLYPHNKVSYVCDTNPNYTNICVTKCKFCAFSRDKKENSAYTLSPEELVKAVAEAEQKGATTVLLQGGHNPALSLEDRLQYLRAIRTNCPKMHIHPFDPAEIIYIAAQEKISSKDVLQKLHHEGIDTLPGGGAEVLSNRVRKIISPAKCNSEDWLRVMEEAHRIGFHSTATMMYGHLENDEEIVDHLLKLRDLQDETNGFFSFVPWSFKPGSTKLSAMVKHTAHPIRYIRIIALARLTLDNFPHIQSSWFSESIRAGQLGLLAGADDFGGLLITENVLKEAGHQAEMNLSRLHTIIREAGFEPEQRDSYYNLLS